MSDLDYRPEPEELTDAEFEQALRAQTRRRAIAAVAIVGGLATLLAMPWSHSIEVTGRVAPARWAKVRSEVPGVVREVKRKGGDVVQEGDVIAVLDSDEQRDALEGARLALTRERQKLADLELRLQQNRILRIGTDAAVHEAEQRVVAAESAEDSRLEALEPAAASVIEGVRAFTIKVRGQLSIDGRGAKPLHADAAINAVETAMAAYVERAEAVAEHLSNGAGEDAARDLTARLDAVRFTFALADSSMREIALKHEVVVRGLLAPVELRSIVDQLERESRDLTQSFSGMTTVTRGLTGSPAERREWVRTAEEKRQLLGNETDRVEAERQAVASSISQAELMVRAAERNEGKTAIHAPISGTLSETGLAELDGVGQNASVGVIEDNERLVLKVRVLEADWPLVAEGQAVTAKVGRQKISGTVSWKVPRAGQEVRDQEWNLLVQVDSDTAGIELGSKVEGEVVVGRRSLLRRLLDRQARPQVAFTSGAGSRLALVNDPTELRSSSPLGELAATDAAGAAVGAGVVGTPRDN